MTRLEKIKALRKKEVKVYYQKVVPTLNRIKGLTVAVGLLYLVSKLVTQESLVEIFRQVAQLVLGLWWLVTLIEFTAFRFQLNFIRGKIHKLRQKQNEKNKTN